jgi:hypothetical protein
MLHVNESTNEKCISKEWLQDTEYNEDIRKLGITDINVIFISIKRNG